MSREKCVIVILINIPINIEFSFNTFYCIHFYTQHILHCSSSLHEQPHRSSRRHITQWIWFFVALHQRGMCQCTVLHHHIILCRRVSCASTRDITFHRKATRGDTASATLSNNTHIHIIIYKSPFWYMTHRLYYDDAARSQWMQLIVRRKNGMSLFIINARFMTDCKRLINVTRARSQYAYQISDIFSWCNPRRRASSLIIMGDFIKYNAIH